ncbi:hypothetical protein K227x_04270 [Rubripirellula lacrimiformis]|uniref:Uncharacterized protein n=1 Tax=Rubripirellula lacrimiformis TaxID=1930273 RepID=A0A517N4J6_9BACT|nr:hypothetical protein [Rubripirellula lacrimiformis]QDT02056.1 hypothetical protein K227x_04270 [Rubripirellula lacrimiformis]
MKVDNPRGLCSDEASRPWTAILHPGRSANIDGCQGTVVGSQDLILNQSFTTEFDSARGLRTLLDQLLTVRWCTVILFFQRTGNIMNMKLQRLAIAVAPALALAFTPILRADEPSDRGARYEDDAWYDVSEWFDGNDYNPTDEAIGRWDDERFDYRDKQTSTDTDNDIETVDAEEFYGEDWDDGYATFSDKDRDGHYESYSRYHDTDGDYLNDSYATYKDDDGDGMYESYQFSDLAGNSEREVHSSNVAQSTQKGLVGKAQTVSGKITESKYVRRLGGLALLLQVNANDGKSVWVDMGSDPAFQLFEGDSLTATGPISKAGNKQVLVATEIETQGKQVPITRNGRRYSGKIESTRTAKVRGEQRTVAKVKTEDGKTLTVDMGVPSEEKKWKKGDEVNVTGVPVKIGDRVILIADKTKL